MTERKKYYEKKFWEKSVPEDVRHKHLSVQGVKTAKAKARAAGRPYPNMVDNITAARAGLTKGKKK
jgi:hypothetical protein